MQEEDRTDTKKRSWAWALVGAVVTVAVTVTTSDAQDANYSAMLYRQHCASCHGEDGRGHGPVEPYLTVKPSDLTRIAARRGGDFPRDQLGRIIAGDEAVAAHGTRTMPIWGEQLQVDVIGTVNKPVVARGRIGFLVDYLETLQGTGEKEFENLILAPPSAPPPGTTPRR
jgi:mono/diheme cytochrome c family protein